jgi:hypothetical protein
MSAQAFPEQQDPTTRSDRDNIIYLVAWAHSMNDWHERVDADLDDLRREDNKLERKVGLDGWLTRVWAIATLIGSSVLSHWLSTGRLLP